MYRTIATVAILFCLSVSIGEAHTLNPKVIEKLTGETITEEHHEEAMVEADPRHESRTFYSFPEWYIVYSAQEYGDFVVQGGQPSGYPYLQSIMQMWESWDQSAVAAETEPDATTNTVLWTIAVSYTIETAIIGLYENTIGRVSELSYFGNKTTEDLYIDAKAEEYGLFLNQTPWYQFPYLAALSGLWQTYGWSSVTPRGIERRVAYSIGYAVKTLYASAIGYLSAASFEGGASPVTHATVVADDIALQIFSASNNAQKVTDNTYEVDFPRYRAFKDLAVAFALAGGDFVRIANNDTIALSVVASNQGVCASVMNNAVYALPLVSNPLQVRYMLETSVTELADLIRTLNQCALTVEHIYDY